ncbi:hypothetical protein KEM56_006481 [Ascosphaera pollenicola]|nr:hypothetical protein KEM56_006481 [Ascosphaera pollenicola]
MFETESRMHPASIPEGYEHVFDRSGGVGQGPEVISTSQHLEVVCGPLLNYKGMLEENSEKPLWKGSVLIVTHPGQQKPILHLRCLGPAKGELLNRNKEPTVIEGAKLYADLDKEFWRFSITVATQPFEACWEYTIPRFNAVHANEMPPRWCFFIPAAQKSMRSMFHSCNGFSIGTDMDVWKGPNLWKEVMRIHEKQPFHCMIGGGDQIYNDSIRIDGPLRAWTDISNPHKRRGHDFSETMRAECDNYYSENYVKWFSGEEFAKANSQIPQINVWDDHDIIDGFGSYVDHFMKCAVFRGIGGISFKYYCLFQHHIAPPISTYTTDAPETMQANADGTAGGDPRQLANSWVYQEPEEDISWIIGTKPGPYVEERSRSIYMRLGRKIAFLGVDARTERTRHQVNYPETYDAIFNRAAHELQAAQGQIKHLILLLGVPIAYPRLYWLENLFQSPAMAPIRLLNKRFGVGGDFFNKFDGQVDLLDDLDDHYTCKHHKAERRELLQRLQRLSRKFSVRVTILGGDVHLAAVGRFYSNLELGIPPELDFRFMANVISSAITNKPPPKAVANLLAKRNKLHHLDPQTDETLMDLFDKPPGGKEKAASWNKVTLPSRNFACITEHEDEHVSSMDINYTPDKPAKTGHDPLNKGETGAGTTYPSADGISATSGVVGGLDISIRVEIDSRDVSGATDGYGLSVPPLEIPPGKDRDDDNGEHSSHMHLPEALHWHHKDSIRPGSSPA